MCFAFWSGVSDSAKCECVGLRAVRRILRRQDWRNRGSARNRRVFVGCVESPQGRLVNALATYEPFAPVLYLAAVPFKRTLTSDELVQYPCDLPT